MIWEAVLYKSNDAPMLKLKANILAQLILNASSVGHQFAQLEAGNTFTLLQKQLSEAEMATLHLAFSFYFIRRFITKVESDQLCNDCIQLILSALKERHSGQELSLLFTSRFAQLAKLLEKDSVQESGPWLPAFKNSYEHQCGILGVPVNAAVAVSFQATMLQSIRRWELEQLTTGNPVSSA